MNIKEKKDPITKCNHIFRYWVLELQYINFEEIQFSYNTAAFKHMAFRADKRGREHLEGDTGAFH